MPAPARRLFPDDPPAVLAAPAHRGYVTTRLLETGDRDDLRWLFERLGEARVAAHLHDVARGLDRRNRAFWSLALGVDIPPPRRDLPWPLAH